MKHIIIVGGGSAGWLTAGILASKYKSTDDSQSDNGEGVKITVVESPDVATIGVGEGTWPSMRSTLKAMGVSETEFMRDCDVSLKQGTRFQNWSHNKGEFYYHPYSLPEGFHNQNLAQWANEFPQDITFDQAVSSQATVCERFLAPKNISTPEYAFNLNYGYHLNAGKFSIFLHKHCTEFLGVNYIQDHMICVEQRENGEFSALTLRKRGSLEGDLFIDCTGFSAELIHKQCDISYHSLADVLHNDKALALTVPYSKADKINSSTHSTAQEAGWIWDIGLKSRRGIGYVYSSKYSSEDEALEILKSYISNTSSVPLDSFEPRQLSFSPKYLQKFWHKNCVAIGLSAGFVEPLEASALVLIETAAKAVADLLPLDDSSMAVAEKRFNDKMHYHWAQIIDFLKLHYVLSSRSEPYWTDSKNPETIPDSLVDSLNEWQYKVPYHLDAPRVDELFSSASFQYVLFGMGYKAPSNIKHLREADMLRQTAQQLFVENQKKTQHWLNTLPSNQDFLNKVAEHGMQKI